MANKTSDIEDSVSKIQEHLATIEDLVADTHFKDDVQRFTDKINDLCSDVEIEGERLDVRIKELEEEIENVEEPEESGQPYEVTTPTQMGSLTYGTDNHVDTDIMAKVSTLMKNVNPLELNQKLHEMAKGYGVNERIHA